jgi:thiamine-phosphate pyrophosphorylase
MLSHTCGIYLVSPIGLANGALGVEDFAGPLAQALDSGPVEAFLLRTSGSEGRADDALLLRQIESLLPVARQRGVPFVLEERADLAMRLGCDGVHLWADRQRVAAVRRALGEAPILGAAAGASRHAAMEAADAGADYVTFGLFDPEPQPPDEDLLGWWQELMEPPAVAMGGITLDNARRMAEAGADFVALRNAVWNHEQGPAAALKAFRALLR